jgi:hypothetical protein
MTGHRLNKLNGNVIIAMMWVLLTFHPIEGAATRWYQNLFAAVFVVVFGFLFVTVAGRISGLLGNSSNPISGMSIATLMATCAIFFVAGWTSPNYAVLALMIGGVVCIAAAIAGATSQDLKTGYLVGATPYRQQIGFIIGVQKRTFRDQDPVNIQASELMGKLHDALKASGYDGHDLERLLVRLLFCLFADDTGIFEPRGIFDSLIRDRTGEDGSDTGQWLNNLFDVLNIPESRRQKALDEDLRQFAYINRRPFCRTAAGSCFRPHNARQAARSLRFFLGRNLACDFRRAVPVGHERPRAARAGRTLHDREKHPEGNRAAVPR